MTRMVVYVSIIYIISIDIFVNVDKKLLFTYKPKILSL